MAYYYVYLNNNCSAQTYAKLREQSKDHRDRTLPITARQLETLIRLSSALAKTRLSTVIEENDAKVAASIMGKHYNI